MSAQQKYDLKTPNGLAKAMRDPRYWRDRDPDFIMQITEGFRFCYPEKTKMDELNQTLYGDTSPEMKKWTPPPIEEQNKQPENVLERANQIVKNRGENYGHPFDDFNKTALMWSAILGVKVTPDQVAKCMICVKLSRLSETPDHQDSIDDLAGYTWCLDEVTKKMKEQMEWKLKQENTNQNHTQSKPSKLNVTA